MPPDKLSEAIDAFMEALDAMPQETRDPEAEAQEFLEKSLLSIQDRIQLWARYTLEQKASASASKIALSNQLLRKIPEDVDLEDILVLMDSLESGACDQKSIMELIKRTKMVEICLPNLASDFARGLRLIDANQIIHAQAQNLSLEQVYDSLLAKNGLGLQRATAMQGGGELFGIDENGKFLFKDRGTEPVIFGFDANGNLLTIHNRNPEQMEQVQEWATYEQIYEAVYGPENDLTGYELFPDSPDCEKIGMIRAIEEITGLPFVHGTEGNEARASWLNSGRNLAPDVRTIRVVYYHRSFGYTLISLTLVGITENDRGAMRLLRV